MTAPVRPLSVESLESRTLLAADPFGLVGGDFDLTKNALSGTGSFGASFSTNFGNSQLVLTGGSEVELTIDLDRLPNFITNLNISAFSEVTFLGTDRVETLVLSNVGSVSAPNLSVTNSLHVQNVGSLNLAEVGSNDPSSVGKIPIAVLTGTSLDFTAGSLDKTIIISDLQTLTLTAQSDVLLIVSLNSEQSVQLTYSSASLDVPGLAPKSSAGSPPGTGTGDPANPGQDSVVVITVPADDRTLAFITNLRELLRTSNGDPRQMVLEFVASTAQASTGPASPATLVEAAPSIESIRLELDVLARTVESPVDFQPGVIAADKPVSVVDAEIQTGPDGERFVGRLFDVAPVDLPTEIIAQPTSEIDATWPVALAPMPVAEARPTQSSEVADEQGDMKLEDTFRALGSYLVERVSAEFTPGQQSFVLLVDPRPSRSSGKTPTSALDLFAQGNSASVATFREITGVG